MLVHIGLSCISFSFVFFFAHCFSILRADQPWSFSLSSKKDYFLWFAFCASIMLSCSPSLPPFVYDLSRLVRPHSLLLLCRRAPWQSTSAFHVFLHHTRSHSFSSTRLPRVHANADNIFLQDDSGRIRFFHGLNFVQKSFPWCAWHCFDQFRPSST